jgi:DNA phosphorothioation-associated putative methyltransferase
MLVARHRTAISRYKLSRPVSLALDDGLINVGTRVFDYGCGRGDDVRNLQGTGISCSGWDPVHCPGHKVEPADVINLGYVINVIEDAAERKLALQNAWSLTEKVLIVSARLVSEAREINAPAFEDGYLTRLSTFQKFYEQHELREWIDTTLGSSSVPAGPGVFYVFRDEGAKQSFASSRFRRSRAVPRLVRTDIIFEQHKSLLEPLMAFFGAHGRLPEESELNEVEEIRKNIGSVKKAFSVIRHVTGQEQWYTIRQERAQDLLIYIALSRFGRRPRFSNLPNDLQLDIRAFFRNYRKACEMADDLLFSAGDTEKVDHACRTSTVGKLMPTAIYVHVSALQALPQILRVYEGCARSYIGSVEGANVIKLSRGEPRVSYLSYSNFERDPHPALVASLTVPLQTFRIKFRDYRESDNPFILHRKEEFVSADNPLREKFAKLTLQEERRGLYSDPSIIGTRDGWRNVLRSHKIRLVGHRVVRETPMAR